MNLTLKELENQVNAHGEVAKVTVKDGIVRIQGLYSAGDYLNLEEYTEFNWEEVRQIAQDEGILLDEALELQLSNIKMWITASDEVEEPIFLEDCYRDLPQLNEVFAQKSEEGDFYGKVVQLVEQGNGTSYFLY